VGLGLNNFLCSKLLVSMRTILLRVNSVRQQKIIFRICSVAHVILADNV